MSCEAIRLPMNQKLELLIRGLLFNSHSRGTQCSLENIEQIKDQVWVDLMKVPFKDLHTTHRDFHLILSLHLINSLLTTLSLNSYRYETLVLKGK